MKKIIMIAGTVVLSSINFAPLTFSQGAICNFTLNIIYETPMITGPHSVGEMTYPNLNITSQAPCDTQIDIARANTELIVKNGFWNGARFYPPNIIKLVTVIPGIPVN